MRSPAFQFYPKQWLGDDKIMLMSWPARAMHLHLICIAWQQQPPCTLPNDESMLRRWCGDPPDWENLKTEIFRAWRLNGDRFVQVGLLEQHLKQQAFSESRKRGAAARWGKGTSDASALHMQCITDALHLQSSISSSDSNSFSSEHQLEPDSGAPQAKGKSKGDGLTAEQELAFAPCWEAWPRKESKQAARKAFAKALKSGVAPEVIIAAIKRQKADLMRDGLKFCPHLSSWLNDLRWEDEEGHEDSNTPKGEGVTDKLAQEFQLFAEKYPRQVKLDEAFRSWMRLVERGEITEANVHEVHSGLARYIDSEDWENDGGKYIPDPVTFLTGNIKHNGRLWKDKPNKSQEALELERLQQPGYIAPWEKKPAKREDVA